MIYSIFEKCSEWSPSEYAIRQSELTQAEIDYLYHIRKFDLNIIQIQDLINDKLFIIKKHFSI